MRKTAAIVCLIASLASPPATSEKRSPLGALLKETETIVIYDDAQAERAVLGTVLDCRLVNGMDREIPYDTLLRGAMSMLNYQDPPFPAKLILSSKGGRTYGYMHLFDQKTGMPSQRILGIALDGPGRVVMQRMLNSQAFPAACAGATVPLR